MGYCARAGPNASGQLAGFLAYDIVLLPPFLTRLPSVAPEYRVSLIIYTAVLVYSALIAGYYLFLHPETRLRGMWWRATVGAQ